MLTCTPWFGCVLLVYGRVTVAGRELTGWQVFPLPMENFSRLQFSKIDKIKINEIKMPSAETAPVYYRGHFDLRTTGDTFLDLRGWGKGAVWVNGHALGRFWNIGPQQTLYVPGPWLKKGSNEVIVFTLGAHTTHLRGLRAPVLDEMGSD